MDKPKSDWAYGPTSSRNATKNHQLKNLQPISRNFTQRYVQCAKRWAIGLIGPLRSCVKFRETGCVNYCWPPWRTLHNKTRMDMPQSRQLIQSGLWHYFIWVLSAFGTKQYNIFLCLPHSKVRELLTWISNTLPVSLVSRQSGSIWFIGSLCHGYRRPIGYNFTIDHNHSDDHRTRRLIQKYQLSDTFFVHLSKNTIFINFYNLIGYM